jgi:hypothetical protein
MASAPCGRRDVAAIHLGRALPRASCNLPGWRAGNCPESCLSRHPYSVLLPVWFTVPLSVAGSAVGSYPTLSPLPASAACAAPARLARPGLLRRSPKGEGERFAFCGTVTGVAPAGCYPAPCLHGARTFLRRSLSALAPAAARPAGVAYKGIPEEKRNPRSMIPKSCGLLG